MMLKKWIFYWSEITMSGNGSEIQLFSFVFLCQRISKEGSSHIALYVIDGQ
jgi:hypothetical protein